MFGRVASVLLVVVLVALLSACQTTPDPNYYAYLQSVAAENARDASDTTFAELAKACNGDERCIERVANGAVLKEAFRAVGNGRQSVQQFQRQPSTAERIGLALVGQLAPLANAAVSWHQSDNSRETAIAQYGFLEGVVRSSNDSAAAIATAGPRIDVGGDYISGSQHIGDTVGRDQVSGTQHVGDAIGRDAIGGDRIDVGGDWRQASPGPIDNSNDGDDCTGSDCSTPPPPSDPEG